MVAHYLTLFHLSRELQKNIAGFPIQAAYSQVKNQLCIEIIGEKNLTFIISCNPLNNFAYFKEGFWRSRQNSVDIFPFLAGRKIIKAEAEKDDRVLILTTDAGKIIRCNFFGSKSNILVCTAETGSGLIVRDAFLHKKENINLPLTTSRRPLLPDITAATVSEFFYQSGSITALRALKTAIPSFGTTLANEAMYRSGVKENSQAVHCTGGEIERIVHHVLELLKTIEQSPDPQIYSRDDEPLCFALTSLETHREDSCEKFSSVSKGIQRFVSRSFASSSFLSKKKEIVQRLQQESERIDKKERKIEEDLENAHRSDEYRRKGTLLMGKLDEMSKGMKLISVTDELTNESVKIELDPSLPPVRNAERYFDKGKKAITAEGEQGLRLKEIKEYRTLAYTMLHEAEETANEQSLKIFLEQYAAVLAKFGIGPKGEKQQSPPFRIFTVEGGFQVWAGKNSENNDVLTLRNSKPDDLWFHCRGAGGSHVVLKVDSAPGDPTQKAIEQAASIAAYYSKMKNASMVPVAMTKKKYVHKPKRVPAGTVMIEREKVIYVEAQLPGQTKEE